MAELSKMLPDKCTPSGVVVTEITGQLPEKAGFSARSSVRLNFSLSESQLLCCALDNCIQCCTSPSCLGEDSEMPVVFIHGHALSKDVSAEYSLDAFNKIQEKLEGDGYLNVGAITLYTSPDVPYGVWGKAGVPVTIKASYYFDLFKEPENYVVVQTNSENIDTYAIRLKELVDRVKYRTGKPKVRIIAASMGGLVARRYVQLFGTEDVDRLILLGTPNNGIAGEIADYCPIVGERLECRDMKSGSLFLNKLNREVLPDIPIYNIVGTGCSMGRAKGDGVVLESNALLDGATNYVINGTCTHLKPLHTTILDTSLHPDVYQIIKDVLEKK